MNLLEHQAKEVFCKYGIPIPYGKVISDISQLQEVGEAIGEDRFGVIKAQIATGGRGKAGGIKLVESIAEGQDVLRDIIGKRIKGLTVNRVLVEQKLEIKNEYFMSITLDPEEQLPALLISSKGGMNIEEIAKNFDNAIGKCVIDPGFGLRAFSVIDLINNLGFPPDLWHSLAGIAGKLYKIFSEKDATLIEINPLVETVKGELIAADGRLNIDDNALFRQLEISELKKDFKEMVLKDKGVDYVDLGEGDVGLLCVGAGMTMLTMDLVAQLGNRARCFLDMSHGVNPDGFETAMEVLASDQDIKVILVNMFGGLTRMDEIADSIVEATRRVKEIASKPMVIRIQGTNAEKGQKILRDKGYIVHPELDDALKELKGLLEG